MSAIADLLVAPNTVVTVGVPILDEALVAQGVSTVAVDWRPPGGHLGPLLAAVVSDPRVASANRLAVDRLLDVRPCVVDVRPAADLVGLGPRQLLHAGPPITWERASGPMRGAIVGAALYEGWADTPEAAEALAAGGGLELSPCHDHGAVGPMAGIVSPSMPMWVVEDGDGQGPRSYCSLNEGLGKVLRYGAYGAAVTERLAWMQHVLGPALGDAVRAHGPLDLRALIASMVAMGDEGHNRNRAGTSLFVRAIAPDLVRTIDRSGRRPDDIAEVLAFMAGNDHFALNLVMPAAKLVTDAAAGIDGSTMVTAMARNGTDFAIRVSGTGDRWFAAPAEIPDGLYLGGYGPDDANADIGDSAITETVGLGAFAMAAAPAIVALVGGGGRAQRHHVGRASASEPHDDGARGRSPRAGTVDDAMAWTEDMAQITLTEHRAWTVPALDFQGLPVGIDVTKVVRTGLTPIINTGIAGKVAGTGQIGAGLVRPPMACFTGALAALAETAGAP